MAFTGGVKFFGESACVYGDANVSAEATSGNSIAHHLLDRNPQTAWQSVSSLDVTTETITISFPQATFDRLLLRKMNFKGFNVKYDASGIWTHFAGVVGIDGSKSNITETAFADDTAYYEFTEVTTTGLKIEVTTTQIANAQKFCYQVLAFLELGTLVGFPDISPWALKRNQRSKKLISGKTLIQKSEKSFEVRIDFKNYPASSTYSPDLDLMHTLFDREEPFHLWLCGGKRGSTHVRYAPEGFRLQDIYLVQLDSDLSPGFSQNLYRGPVSLGALVFKEHGGNSPETEDEVTAPLLGSRVTLTNSMAATAFAVFDKLDYRQVIIRYHGYRATLAQKGELSLICNPAGTWLLSGPETKDDGTDLGLTFSITQASGVVTLKVATDGSDGAGELIYDVEYFDAP